jgi:hypothetical protein
MFAKINNEKDLSLEIVVNLIIKDLCTNALIFNLAGDVPIGLGPYLIVFVVSYCTIALNYHTDKGKVFVHFRFFKR